MDEGLEIQCLPTVGALQHTPNAHSVRTTAHLREATVATESKYHCTLNIGLKWSQIVAAVAFPSIASCHGENAPELLAAQEHE